MRSMKFDLDFKENEMSLILKFDCRSEVQKICWSKEWFDRVKKMSKEDWHRKEELSSGFSSKRHYLKFKYVCSSYWQLRLERVCRQLLSISSIFLYGKRVTIQSYWKLTLKQSVSIRRNEQQVLMYESVHHFTFILMQF